MLHGSIGSIVFSEWPVAFSQLGNQIKALNIQSELRLLCSTCCHGDSHSADFIAAGFDTAIVSEKVNANAAVEFAPLLGFRQFEVKLADCITPMTFSTPVTDAASGDKYMVEKRHGYYKGDSRQCKP